MMDEMTVYRASHGDTAAFESLVKPEERRIWQLCWRMMRNEADAADCLQETMIRAWRAMPGFRSEASFGTWLYQIAVRVCIDARRRQAARPAESLDALRDAGYDPPGKTDEPEAEALRREARAEARQALAALPEDQRTVVTLVVLEGQSYEAVSEALGVPLGTVKSRLSRAREQLKKSLKSAEPSADASVQRREGRFRR